MQERIAEIKATTLPGLFRDTSEIGSYGRTEASQDAMAALGDLMEASPVSRLAASIGEIAVKLAEADPRKIAKESTWLERFTGKAVEVRVRYQVARANLDALLLQAEGAAQGVRDAVSAIDRLLTDHLAESAELQAHIQAGREFLAENPELGKPARGSLEFDNVRERFARKLANLATLMSSHDLSVTQMKLTRAQAIDILDRFHETSRILVPVWRQHTLLLASTKHLSPDMVAKAATAHDALKRSLAQSLQVIER